MYFIIFREYDDEYDESENYFFAPVFVFRRFLAIFLCRTGMRSSQVNCFLAFPRPCVLTRFSFKAKKRKSPTAFRTSMKRDVAIDDAKVTQSLQYQLKWGRLWYGHWERPQCVSRHEDDCDVGIENERNVSVGRGSGLSNAFNNTDVDARTLRIATI